MAIKTIVVLVSAVIAFIGVFMMAASVIGNNDGLFWDGLKIAAVPVLVLVAIGYLAPSKTSQVEDTIEPETVILATEVNRE